MICKYEGEIISLKEETKREQTYGVVGGPYTLMVIESTGRQITRVHKLSNVVWKHKTKLALLVTVLLVNQVTGNAIKK